MTTCTRRLRFCAGHRVMGHEGPCRQLHGHNYVVLVTAEGPKLDAIDRVIDFAVLKDRVGRWIDDHWDHGFILNERDKALLTMFESFRIPEGDATAPAKLYRLPLNPTAEGLAIHLLHHVCPGVLKDTGVRVTRVRVWETENCHADAYLTE